MRVYVAGAWIEQHQRTRPMIAKLREAGIEITCDWTQAEGDVCECGHHRSMHGTIADRACSGTEMTTATFAGGAIGLSCVCDGFNGIGSGGDSQLTVEARKQYAQADLDGVVAADVVWLLAANDKGACGSWVELGAALLCDNTIVVSGPKARRTIFTELTDHLFDTDDEALAWLVERSKPSLCWRLTFGDGTALFLYDKTEAGARGKMAVKQAAGEVFLRAGKGEETLASLGPVVACAEASPVEARLVADERKAPGS